jgi:hypothetical protein
VILSAWAIAVFFIATHVAMLGALGIDFAMRPEVVLEGLSAVPKREHFVEKFILFPIKLLNLIGIFPVTVLVILGSYAMWWKVHGVPGLICIMALHAFAATQYRLE